MVAALPETLHHDYDQPKTRKAILRRREKRDAVLQRKNRLVGVRFGKLVVVRRYAGCTPGDTIQSVLWECRCDCGEEHVVYTCNLTSGNTKSCGTCPRDFTPEHRAKLRKPKSPEHRAKLSAARKAAWARIKWQSLSSPERM